MVGRRLKNDINFVKQLCFGFNLLVDDFK